MRRAESCEALRGHALSAINSGMAVRLRVYESYRYDESLFLDYVDHDFMAMCREKGLRIHVLEQTRLYQNFSGDSHPGYQQAMTRYSIFEKDFRTFGKKHGLSPLMVRLLLAHRKGQIKRKQ